MEQCIRLNNSIQKNLKDYFPIVLSGDHSSALGTISGIKSAFPEQNVGVIWIDAHADLHSPYTSPSGNIHGMPLVAALANDNLDAKTNAVDSDTQKYWEEMKQIGYKGPKIQPEIFADVETNGFFIFSINLKQKGSFTTLIPKV